MRSLNTNAVIGGITAKVDKSAKFSVSTPEFSQEEFDVLRDLQGVNVRMIIVPIDVKPEDEMIVDREAGEMSKSQELRWKLKQYYDLNVDKKKWPDFQMYYRSAMDKFISQINEKI